VYTPQSTAAASPYVSYGYGSTGQAFGLANYNGHDPYLAGFSADCDSGISYAAGARLLATGSYANGTESISKNGGTPVTAAQTLNTSSFNLYVGASQYSAGQQCYMHEIILCSGILTATQIAVVQGYLAAKWKMQASLPSTHPYAYAAPKVTY
jgi:hypothetical protein